MAIIRREGQPKYKDAKLQTEISVDEEFSRTLVQVRATARRVRELDNDLVVLADQLEAWLREVVDDI